MNADRPAVRVVAAADETARLWMPPRVEHGCRSRVDGVRCSHESTAHTDVGHGGWRVQCQGCGCTAWRAPWSEPALDVALAAAFWFVLVPSLLEALT